MTRHDASMTTDALVLGAGPAGLAVAACLGRAGVGHRVLEASDRVGDAWHRHYERLHLHTEKRFSALPHRPWPADAPTYPSRQEVVDYLTDYARHFAIEPIFGQRVERAWTDGEAWLAATADATYRARALVVATGYNGRPHRPDLDGLADFAGPVVHSSEYASGRDHAGQEVLVVGCGNSGAEIAIDLDECGARPAIVVRGPVHVVPRDLFGRPVQGTSILLSRLPARVADALTLPIARLATGDLRPDGIVRPAIGPRQQIERHGRVPILDIGLVDRIKAGRVTVVPAVAGLDATGATFADGRRLPFDAVVLATGFESSIGEFLEAPAGVLDGRDRPRVHGAEAAPGLHFVGFRNPPTGALREIAIEAERIGRALAGDS